VSIVPSAASPAETAAIVAATEQFRRDTAIAPPSPPAVPSAWARAALLEATGHADGVQGPRWDAGSPE